MRQQRMFLRDLVTTSAVQPQWRDARPVDGRGAPALLARSARPHGPVHAAVEGRQRRVRSRWTRSRRDVAAHRGGREGLGRAGAGAPRRSGNEGDADGGGEGASRRDGQAGSPARDALDDTVPRSAGALDPSAAARGGARHRAAQGGAGERAAATARLASARCPARGPAPACISAVRGRRGCSRVARRAASASAAAQAGDASTRRLARIPRPKLASPGVRRAAMYSRGGGKKAEAGTEADRTLVFGCVRGSPTAEACRQGGGSGFEPVGNRAARA